MYIVQYVRISCMTVYTKQHVQISCTTQHTLYSMYTSHVQHNIILYCTVCTDLMYNTVYTIQYVQISCTTQYIYYTICTDHKCWLQWNCWGQTTVFQKPFFVESNEHGDMLYCVCTHTCSKTYRKSKFH